MMDCSDLNLCGNPSVPAYQQLKTAIRNKILSGEWPAGHLIPSENQLAKSLGLSRMTVHRPLRELTTEGLLRRVHGLGTFVAEPAQRAQLLELVAIADEIKHQGKTHTSQLLSSQTIECKRGLAQRMQLKTGEPVYKIEVVHYQDEVPIQFESRYVNPSLVPDFLTVDFTSTTAAEYLIKTIRADELEHIVQAILPDEAIAEQLDIPKLEPCIKLKRRTFKGDQVITAVDLIYPSSRYELGARYVPTQ